MTLFEKHKETLQRAIKANHERTFYAHYPEHPKEYGEEASEKGKNDYEALLNNKFEELLQDGAKDYVGEEESPYTGEKLGVKYPRFDVQTLVERSNKGFEQWRKVMPEERAVILVEALENIKERFFEIGFATQHTTGQGFMMAFQASGPHGNDRALEAIGMGLSEMERFPDEAHWERTMGKYEVNVKKEWRPEPKGIGIAIGVSTFPIWNSIAGVFSDLVTGNTVIYKPHPMAILPAAIEVATIQKTLKNHGYDPNIIQLAVDTPEKQITKDLAEHDQVRLIDFTGSKEFGDYIESLEHQDKVTFTEKSGVNSLILDSVEDMDGVMQNIAFSLCLYSGQMCTAPQNIYIPKDGITVQGEKMAYDEVVKKLTDAITGLVEHPKMGPGTLGAIQSPNTLERIQNKDNINGSILLESTKVKQEGFENARTASPAVLEIDSSDKEAMSKEHFGPLVLVVKTKNTDESIQLAQELARTKGAITASAYATDDDKKEKIKDELSKVFAPVSLNFIGPVWVNLNVAFSDFHLTGGNPAGNAGFSNPEFLQKRYVWVGHKEVV